MPSLYFIAISTFLYPACLSLEKTPRMLAKVTLICLLNSIYSCNNLSPQKKIIKREFYRCMQRSCGSGQNSPLFPFLFCLLIFLYFCHHTNISLFFPHEIEDQFRGRRISFIAPKAPCGKSKGSDTIQILLGLLSDFPTSYPSTNSVEMHILSLTAITCERAPRRSWKRDESDHNHCWL